MNEIRQQQRQEELADMNRIRDAINQINLADLLIKIQKGMTDGKCVVESLGKEIKKPCDGNCEMCIMKYLNEKK